MYISSTKRLKNKRNILIKLTSLLAFFLISLSGIAQTALFSYQAVVRNSQNEIVANSTIGVRISLLRNSPSDPAEFAERHVVQTNANGLFTLLVGTGTNIFGNISTIDWGSYTYYLKSEIDPTGGTYYTITGTQPITGVPFAYYSLGTNYTEQQVISISNDTVFLTGGTNSFVKLPIQHITIPDSVSAFINDAGYITSDSIPSNVSAFNNDAGYITSAAIPTNVSAFNNDAGYITAYVDSQQISISNDTISLDRGGFVKLPAVNIPSNVSAFNNDALYITSDSIPDNVSAFNNDAGYITSAAIPTNVSAFSNDAGYITAYVDSQQIAISNDTIFLDRGGFVKLPVVTIPSNVSAFNNDAGYITIDSIPSNVSVYNNDAGYITSADIPTNVSAFSNDAGYITTYVDSQQIAISNDTIFLDRGGFVKLPAPAPSCCILIDSLKEKLDSLRKDFDDLKKSLSPPSVQTVSILTNTLSGATVSGNVTAQGGAAVSDRGICWNTSPAPTLANSYTSSGSGLGIFSGTVTGLAKNTTYYVRAYASNLFGTDYGADLSFTTCKDTIIVTYDTIMQGNTYNWRGNTYSVAGIYSDYLTSSGGCDSIIRLNLTVIFQCGTSYATDIDGNNYATIQMGTQCWFKENLRTQTFPDGTPIPTSSSSSDTLPYYYYPNKDASLVPTYGQMYNWTAAMNSSSAGSMPVQGACPDGWHLPSMDELATLKTYTNSVTAWRCNNSSNRIGKALASQIGWASSTSACAVGNDLTTNNASGFSLMPAGYTTGNSVTMFNQNAFLWSSNDIKASNNCYYLTYSNYNFYTSIYSHTSGMSVRCIYGTGGRVKVKTAAISSIGSNSVVCGGNVSIDGGNAVSAKGVCWSTSQNPTISNSHTTDGSGLGSFTSTITGLTAMTPYYIRAYATNSLGTVYGDEIMVVIPNPNDGNPCTGTPTVSDYNGNVYNTIQFGSQCWMKENLRSTSYSDATAITYGGSNSSTNSAYYYYPYGNSSNISTMGLLYNYYAANRGAANSNSNPSGVQGICPSGWHLPSCTEWTQLTTYIGGILSYQCDNSYENYTKAMCITSGWTNGSGKCQPGYQQNSNNSSNFSIYPSGGFEGSSYTSQGNEAHFWTSRKLSSSAYYIHLSYYSTGVYQWSTNLYKGCSVRCVKD